MKATNNKNQHLLDQFLKLKTSFLSNKNTFKLRALNKVIPQIAGYPEPIISGEYAVENLEGIGKGFRDRIDEILKTGSLKELEDLSGNGSAIEELSRVTGIGPTYAKKLVGTGIKTIDALRKAVSKGDLKLTKHRMIGLKYLDDFEQRIPASKVRIAEKIIKKATSLIDPKILVTICGSYRRGLTTSGDIDVLMTIPGSLTEGKYLTQIVKMLTEGGFLVDDLTHDGNKKYMGVCIIPGDGGKGRRIDIRFVPYSAYYPAMLYFTGSRDFNIMMRKRALELGYSLNEYGLHKIDGDTAIHVDSEKEIFDLLDMKYVDPTDRDLGSK